MTDSSPTEATKMYQDTLKLIATGKSKLIEELKKGLKDIDPIDSN